MYSLCCQQGKVDLPLLGPTPPLLDALLDINGGPVSRHFRKHIRSYNAAFSWTSFGARFDPRLLNSRDPYSLILCGENYHHMGSLLPPVGEKLRYAQLYVFDPTSEINDRLSNTSSSKGKLRPSIVADLKEMLDEYNVLAKSFRKVCAALQQPENQSLRLRISGARVHNGHEYVLPTGTELAGLIPGDFEPNHDGCDIIVNSQATGLTRITSLNRCLIPCISRSYFPMGTMVSTLAYGGMRYMKQLFLDAIAICMHTIEFQKRGLPHVHILVWLAKEAKLETPNLIDQMISAELPDPVEDPIGYAAVTRFMLHGPCGPANPVAPCMVDGKCKKRFPKQFNTETTFDENGYAVSRRRDSGITAVKSSHTLDNSCVIPYNRDLIVKYPAHINVEACHKGQLIKFLFKYITKGPDQSNVIADQRNTNASSSQKEPQEPVD
ncbi:hypothetical protein LINGRAHAP2_LOCUS14393 [Linum grandiflorum]